VPLLDTRLLARLASGRKSETYYPVAVADGKFHCIILKGGDLYPYFPRPLLSEFEFSVPLASAPPPPPKAAAANGEDGDAEMRDAADASDDEDATDKSSSEQAEARRLEQQLVLGRVETALLRDLVDASSASSARELRATLARQELDHDKTLLQMLAGECRAGEERGMRALEIVTLMLDRSGRMAEAAGKVAQRYGRAVLAEKIGELAEELAVRGDGEDEDD
jgi:chromosome transmission fidelity protein 4